MSFLRGSIDVLVALFVLGGVFGCESKGPGSQAGEKSDVTMEKAQEQTEEATEATGVTLEEAEKEVKEATK